jgi:hypothetical protein
LLRVNVERRTGRACAKLRPRPSRVKAEGNDRVLTIVIPFLTFVIPNEVRDLLFLHEGQVPHAPSLRVALLKEMGYMESGERLPLLKSRRNNPRRVVQAQADFFFASRFSRATSAQHFVHKVRVG